MFEWLIDSGVAFTLAVQSWAGGLAEFWQALSFLGTTEFYLVLLPLIYWCFDKAFAVRLTFLLLIGSALNVILKLAWRLPRPFWISADIYASHFEPTFGAPSGHSQTPLSLWGLAATTLSRPWFTWLAAALVALIGFSRIALGLHFHFDVLSGWLLGLLALWAFLRFEKPVTAWLLRLSLARQVLVALAASLLLIALGALAIASAGDFAMPADWERNSLAVVGSSLDGVFSLSELITPAATLFGFGAGLAWLESRGGFRVQGTIEQKSLRYLLGTAVVLALWAGLGAVFPRQADLLSYALRYLRYALIGFWGAGLAPEAFVRLGLARRA
ncbi:MAG: phosphatase PAP2 family protein [Anaerolineales bacterium]|nr:phosphatase PAP2 family protein [Anaerolineales bacterium]MCW5855984.1 phosphatase PAP2 family protein [Anaerolineales bacterium]